MREKLSKSQRRSVKRWAAGVALLPLILCSAAWADNYKLDSVDFASSGGKINIVFHTGSIVPVQKVLVSPNKLILDIEQVNADDTVKTNFVQASNISHIIMQPLGEHKIRLIVRGESLGQPAIAFFNPNMGAYSLPNPAHSGPKAPENKPATLSQESEPQNTALTQQELDLEPAVDAQPLPDAAPDSLAMENVIPVEPTQPAPTAKTAVESLTEPLALSQGKLSKATSHNLLSEFKLPRTWQTYIPYGLLGLVLLGILGFVAQRILRLKQAEKPLEDYITEEHLVEEPASRPAQGKRSSFREMADDYRSKRGQQASKKPNADEMISLRSLKQMDIIDETPEPVKKPEAPTSKTLENLLTALQEAQVHKAAPAKPVTPKAAPPKQAVNQYLKNQPQTAKNKPAAKPLPRDREYQEILQRELQRAQEIQGQVKKQLQANPIMQQRKPSPPLSNKPAAAPVNRAPAAARKNAPVTRPGNRPANNQQGPLPGNPEVLDFLRNVADLMEKDGKADIANSIHKNLKTQNLKLT